ncbi:MAG: 2-phospho-L-lactate transferase [Candidatus Hydrothermarchaeota archaeon]
MSIVILSGGTGTPKLLQGLKRELDQKDMTIIVNTAEDLWLSNMFISPDIDTVIYTLLDIINEETWYGIRGDTFFCHEELKKLGQKEILRIGDRDRAFKLQRTLLLKSGLPLSKAIKHQLRILGLNCKVLPMTNDRVATRIHTPEKTMSFHEFWVEKRGKVDVLDVTFEGLEDAEPLKEALVEIKEADKIIIGPSNPITSILPIINLKGFKKAILESNSKKIAISPIIGNSPVSGPAGKFMNALGYKVSPESIPIIYDFLDIFVADTTDNPVKSDVRTEYTNIIMKGMSDKIRLARFLLSL